MPYDLLCIAPSADVQVRQAVSALKRKAGLWEALCKASLWQTPTHRGNPVHDERSALCAIFNHLGYWESGAHTLADGFLEVLGAETVRALLSRLGEASFERTPWLYWMRVSGGELREGDLSPERFLDGWRLRFAPNPGERENIGEPYDPRTIPPTGDDEKVYWAWDEDAERVYPLVY